MKAKIYGRFRSATKVTGTILLSEITAPDLPEAECAGVQKITFTAYYVTRTSVTPKLGLYYGQWVGPPEDGSVRGPRETELKVVKIGKHGRGAQLRVSPFPATCTGDFKGGPFGAGCWKSHPSPS